MRKKWLPSALVCCAALFGLVFGGCGQNTPNASLSPSVAHAATPSPAVRESPKSSSHTESDTVEDTAWKTESKRLRADYKGYEYYFDTENPIDIGDEDEYPLYKRGIKDGDAIYTGITGYSFTSSGKYLYVLSDLEIGDSTSYRMRILSMEDGAVYPVEDHISLYIAPNVSNVYYTRPYDRHIYIADARLQNAQKILVTLPDWKAVLQKANYPGEPQNPGYNISITRTAKGWVYFNCTVDFPTTDAVYTGGYRISMDGKHIEKTDAGQMLQGFSD
jgi:hypothetical protein